MSRSLTKTEQKWGQLEQQISLVSWSLRKVRRYSSTAPKIVVFVEEPEEVMVVLDKESHLRLRALMVDLQLYRCEWKAGYNPWKLGQELVEYPDSSDTSAETTAPPCPPVMEHK